MTTLTDLYPTRPAKLERAYITRVDPVVYDQTPSVGTSAALSEMQCREFEEKGYLKLQLLDESRVAELNRAAAELQEILPHDDPRIILEPEGEVIRSIFAVHKFNAYFADLASGPLLAPIARRLLGGDVYLHQTRMNYKPGFQGREFYWHSDFETWHSEDGMPRMRAVSCAIALNENFPYNGPLMIIPGSHKLFVACQGETPEENYKYSLRKQDIGVPSHEALNMMVSKWGIDQMIGPAGTVVFFDCNAMHGSNGNVTPCPRNNLFFVYNHIDNTLVEPYCGRAPRPEHIAHRDFQVV